MKYKQSLWGVARKPHTEIFFGKADCTGLTKNHVIAIHGIVISLSLYSLSVILLEFKFKYPTLLLHGRKKEKGYRAETILLLQCCIIKKWV